MERKTLAILFVVITAIGSFSEADSAGNWSYYYHGGSHGWSRKYRTCLGNEQSPINIATKLLVPKQFEPFRMKHFDSVPRSVQFFNNKHTVLCLMNWDNPPEISGGGLNGTYIAKSFHFHWGSDHSKGSEHTIDGEQSAMEMHLVFYNSEYDDEDVLHQSNGIAVFGVFVEIDEKEEDPFYRLELPLEALEQEETIQLDELNLSMADLLPTNIDQFYRYQGSLTTPPCSQVVSWTLFEQPIHIKSSQMLLFSKLKGDEDSLLEDNFRPAQPRNQRVVYYSVINGVTRYRPHFSVMCSALLAAAAVAYQTFN